MSVITTPLNFKDMKVKALQRFGDMHTYASVKVGDVLEMDDARAKSAIERGLVKEFKTEKKEGKPKTSKKEKK